MPEMKLVEQCAGVGDLSRQGEIPRRVRYSISRYQGIQTGNGLPIPGLHRIEGSIAVESDSDVGPLVGLPLTLRLEDGRAIGIRLADTDGRVFAEGHGPSRCPCCS